MIPKISHQIWMQGFENIPNKFNKNVEKLHTLNLDYDHKQWDEKLLREECKKYSDDCLKRFDSFEQMILKVDLGRYVVLYNYGGISVDTDMVQIKPIKDTPHINSNKFIISKLSFPYKYVGMLNNAIIITPANHPILKDMIDTIINDKRTKNDFLIKELYTQHVTGPFFINERLSKTTIPYTVIDNKYFEPCNSNDILCSIDKDTIMDHQHELSWVSSYINIFIKLFILLLRFLPILILGIIIIVFNKYKKNKKSYRLFR